MPITHIFHLSDIHIRAGDTERSREDEYRCVFDTLFDKLRTHAAIQAKRGLIVVPGDIFHHKNVLNPPGYEIAHHFFQGLSNLSRTVIIRGNHDYRQDLPDEKDFISAIMKNNYPNITYLDKTGTHEFENIGIGLVAIQDALLANATSGISRDLVPFPKPAFSSKVTHSVALFHGSITKARLQNGFLYDSPNGYPLEWFDGYDMVLLGDIHLQQVNRATLVSPGTYKIEKGTWAYPGSLVQQDFGESLLGHGYLEWDLGKGLVHEHHVPNTYGFLKLQIDEKGIMKVLVQKGDPLLLDDCIGEPWFPITVHVRVLGKGVRCSADLLEDIRSALTDADRVVLSIQEMYPIAVAKMNVIVNEGDQETEELDVNSLNQPETWIQFIEENCTAEAVKTNQVWKEWLQDPSKILMKTGGPLDDKIRKYNESLHKYAVALQREMETVVSCKTFLKLKQVEWSWLFNYGASNHFNFEAMDGNLVVLNAKNGYGKSNFFEIVCWSLFGDGFPSREDNNYSVAIFNTNMPSGEHAMSRILFYLNKVEYCIEQILDRRVQLGKDIIRLVSIKVLRIGVSEPVKEGVRAVKEWVQEHIGTKEGFLSSCMLTQNGDCSFFQSGPANQKRLIDSVFSLSAIQSLERLLKDGMRCHNAVADLYETYLAGVQKKAEKAKVNANREALEEGIEEGQGLLMDLEVQIQEAHGGWSALPPKVFALKGLEEYRAEYDGMAEGVLCENVQALKDERGRLENLVLGDSGVIKKPTGKEVRFQGLAERLHTIEQELRLLKDGPVNPSLTIEACREVIQEYRIWKRGKIIPNPVEPLEILSKIAEQTRVYHEMILSQRISGVPCQEEVIRKEIQRLKGLLTKLEDQQALVETLLRHEQEYPMLERRLASSAKDIRDCESLIGESQKFKFNPECAACREQPFKKAEEDARQRLVGLKAERKTLQTQWNAMDDYDSLADLIEKRKEAQKVLRACEDAGRKIEELTANLRFTAWQSTERDCRDSYEKAKLAEEAKRWTTRAAEAEATLVSLLVAEQAQGQAWLQWHQYQYQERFRVVVKAIQDHELAMAKKKVKEIVEAFPFFLEEERLRTQKGEVEMDVQRAQDTLDQLNASSEDEEVRNALKEIAVRKDLLDALSGAFQKYREWLYTQKVGPLIKQSVNRLLVGICEDRPLYLEPVWLNTIDTFSWFLKDGDCRVPINKASGFQQFIIGMVMRITLGRICGHTIYKNLIIDEGFTACDVSNLEKVPAFLKGLLTDYDGVMLATHLDSLKSAGHRQIVISRNELTGVSRIQEGPLLVVEMEEKKRKGRTAKKIEVGPTVGL